MYGEQFPGAQDSIEDKTILAPCETFDTSVLRNPHDYVVAANSSETVQQMEACMAIWIRQIEKVLAESEQMRREADDIGPKAELDHWKKRMAKFNFLVDQLKSRHVKAVVGVLQAAKSKTLQVLVYCHQVGIVSWT